jgi:3-mercaptopyruvate sulfurtransferase SseA
VSRRLVAVLLAAAALVWTVPAPAGDPEVPEKYIAVDQVKARLDAKQRVAFIDVRPREQFEDLHIRGARSIPLREIPTRLAEISRQDFLVLY